MRDNLGIGSGCILGAIVADYLVKKVADLA
jgi:Na+/glutamate symporter